MSADKKQMSGLQTGTRVLHYFSDFARPEVLVTTSSGRVAIPCVAAEPGVAIAEVDAEGQEVHFYLRDSATGREDHPPGEVDYRIDPDIVDVWLSSGTVFDVDPRSLDIELIDAHTHPYRRTEDGGIIIDPAPLLAAVEIHGIGVALCMAQLPLVGQREAMLPLAARHPWVVPIAWLEPMRDTVADAEAMLDAGFHGLKFCPAVSAYDADGPAMDPLVDVAQRRRVPVQIHTATDRHSTPERVAALARRFPGVKFVMIHTELGVTDKWHALSLVQCLPNIFAETSWTNPDGVLLAMRVLDSSRTLFGTDATVDDVEHFEKRSIPDASGQCRFRITDVVAQVRAIASPSAFANWARMTAIRVYGLRFRPLLDIR